MKRVNLVMVAIATIFSSIGVTYSMEYRETGLPGEGQHRRAPEHQTRRPRYQESYRQIREPDYRTTIRRAPGMRSYMQEATPRVIYPEGGTSRRSGQPYYRMRRGFGWPSQSSRRYEGAVPRSFLY